ncbi:hypothetical protein [Bacillus cereus]|uniref:hypothetical protein n=1 Tax=Bacillus cereus TaxID=1396 RepID=UPI002D790F8F|nr:hypothetical protein [Bacillus cereus]
MKTYFEIVENKSYRELTIAEKLVIQERQTELVVRWQDESNESKKEEIFDELHASIKGLVKGMAYRQAEKSFSIEQEDFEGIMFLVLTETLSGTNDEMQVELYGQRLITFDRAMDKPFQPIFITNVRNVLKMMYRQKGYDVHETTLHEANRLDSPSPDDDTVTMADTIETTHSFTVDIEQMVVTEEILTDLFGNDTKKKTMVHMTVQGFKRNEIVSAIISDGQKTEAVAKQVNRTVNQFKTHYGELLRGNLL